MAKRNIVAMGGSAGSGAVLRQIIGSLPADFGGSVFVTTHIPTAHPSHLPEMLRAAAKLPVSVAVDGQPIEPGHVYVAASDRHLLLIDGVIRLGAGPRENMARPSIDPMLRSAAMSYGPRAVGVILSGLLNDGASGLFAIKRAGGVAIVQHPMDAVEDEMPRAALEAIEADHVVRSDEMADLIGSLAHTEAGAAGPVSEGLALEVQVAAGARLGSEKLLKFAQPSTLTCPDCSGVLSEVKDEKPLRYRCQIGHAHTARDLASETQLIDEAIMVAMRIMEERVELVRRMARDARETGRLAVAEIYEARGAEYRRYADTLRQGALLSMRMSRGPDEDLGGQGQPFIAGSAGGRIS